MPRGVYVRTPEYRTKISAAQKGKPKSEAARAKMSAAKMGHSVSEETRAKLSAAHMGNKYNLSRTYSEETRAKQSAAKSKHGHTRNDHPSPTYTTWQNMLNRCRKPTNHDYERYGGNGVGCDPTWDSFAAFLADKGECPPNPPGWQGKQRYYTLDRYPDPDGDYTPENTRWASPEQQAANKSRFRKSRSGWISEPEYV